MCRRDEIINRVRERKKNVDFICFLTQYDPNNDAVANDSYKKHRTK